MYIKATYAGKIILVGCCWISTVMGQGSDFIYRYPMNQSVISDHPAYRWRPPETSSSPITEKPADRPAFNDKAQRVPDYLQSPLGLPRGTYRPLKELPTVSPRVGAYRFRSISPEEQLRITKPNRFEEQQRSNTKSGEIRFREMDSEATFWSPDAVFQHRFRPDERLKRDNDRYRVPAYPLNPILGHISSYTYPQFRQHDQHNDSIK